MYNQITVYEKSRSNQKQCCRTSSDLSDNRTFIMNVRQKNVSVPDQMSDRNYKNIHLVDEKKQNTSEAK